MTPLTELVPIYQDMVHFISVRADGTSMAPVSKNYKINTFPTILIFRGKNILLLQALPKITLMTEERLAGLSFSIRI
jgi:hypothetical protein